MKDNDKYKSVEIRFKNHLMIKLIKSHTTLYNYFHSLKGRPSIISLNGENFRK